MTLSLTLLWANAWFLQPFYTFSSAHHRVIRGTFILTFLCFSVTVFQQALRFWAGIFYPQVFFTLHSFLTFLSRFVTEMWAGTPHPRSFSVPTLTELSLPADAWSWTTHIVDYWFINCASLPRSIESKLNYWICSLVQSDMERL